MVDTAGDIYAADPNATQQTLVPAVVVRDVGANGAAQILAAIRVAGLDQEGSSGVPGDAGVTVFTAQIGGQEIVNRIAAGGPGRPACVAQSGDRAAQPAARSGGDVGRSRRLKCTLRADRVQGLCGTRD